MTTRELAAAIAKAVLTASRPAGMGGYGDAPIEAVLETLRTHGAWFCRVEEDADGLTVETLFELEP